MTIRESILRNQGGLKGLRGVASQPTAKINSEKYGQRNEDESSDSHEIDEDEIEDAFDENADVSISTSMFLNSLIQEGHIDLDDPNLINKLLQTDVPNSPKFRRLLDEWKKQTGFSLESQVTRMSLSDILEEILKKSELTADLVVNEDSNKAQVSRITRKQLLNSAMALCNNYFMDRKSSTKYLSNLPDEMRESLILSIREGKRYDPEVFEEIRLLTFQFLEVECFPKFLGRIALHNLHDEISDWRFHTVWKNRRLLDADSRMASDYKVRHRINSPFSNYTTVSRVAFGLLFLGIAFWLGYTLIFLNYSRAIRVTTLPPFLVGCYCIICGIYQVDIIYALFGVTQKLIYTENNILRPEMDTKLSLINKTFAKSKIENSQNGNHDIPIIFSVLGGRRRLMRVEHEFIRALLFKRGLWCMVLVTITTAAFTVIFSCVPSRRV